MLAAFFLAIHVYVWIAAQSSYWLPSAGISVHPVVAYPIAVLALPALVAFLLFWAISRTLAGFLWLTGVSLAVTVVAVFQDQGRIRRGLAVAGALAIVALPFHIGYSAPVSATGRHELRWPTDPGWLGGVPKKLQVELDGTPCAYRLLEWGADGTLYYHERCGGANADARNHLFAFHPGIDQGPRRVPFTPTGVSVTDVGDVPMGLQSFTVRQVPGTMRTERNHVDGQAIHASQDLVSPDGRWAATVVAVEYDPADIIVVSR